MIKVILIDDHALVRTGIREMLVTDPELEVVGEADTGLKGIELVNSLHPDVVLLDYRLPDMTGYDVSTQLLQTNSDLKILVIATLTNGLIPFRLLKIGVKGYLTKGANQAELISAVKTVYTDQSIISPMISKQIALSKIDDGSSSIFDILSTREWEVMRLIVRGHDIQEIAEQLELKPKTVHSYRTRLFTKLNVNDDVALTFLALQHGIINLDMESK